MAAVDVNGSLSVPGKLCISPSDFTGAFPCGGTALGAARQIIAIPRYRHKEVPLDPFGGEPGEVLYLGGAWKLVASFRSFDKDAIATIFPNTLSTPAGQPAGKTIEHPGTVRAGSTRSSAAVPLLFYPDDPLEHPAVYFYRAIPVIDPALALQLASGAPFEPTAGFFAIRKVSNGKAVSVGLLEYLTP